MTSSRFDVVIAGGEVLDPGTGTRGMLDVGIQDGRIAALDAGLSQQETATVIDASGQLVTPGLVDLHTHVYWGATYWGIEADPVAARSGVTTWLDVGSAGAYSFPGFQRYVVEPNRAKVFSLLNLSSIGLIAPTWEFTNLDYCDVPLAASIVEAHRDVILGIKARIDNRTTRGTGIRPLELARELADQVGLPLMVHIGAAPPSLDEVAALLRPGDILTHCFTGQSMKLVDGAGRVNPAIPELHDRGLILDIGHGAGSFNFDVSEQLLAQGILPDVISSDIHQLSVQGPMFDLPTTLSKFLQLGLSVADVIERATSRAAIAMRRPDLGTLRVGGAADIAVFKLETGEFTFYDAQMNARRGTQRLMNTLTMVDGEVLPRLPERERMPWAELPPHQRQ